MDPAAKQRRMEQVSRNLSHTTLAPSDYSVGVEIQSKKPSCGKVRQKDAKRLKLRPFGPSETGDEACDAFSVLPAQSWSYQVQEDDADAACGELFENVMPRYTWALSRHGLQVIAQVCSSKFFPDQYTYCTLGF